MCFFDRSSASLIISGVGATVTSPRKPSTMTMSPGAIRPNASATPTTAGISRARAMIEV
jgi:hypothetical protein